MSYKAFDYFYKHAEIKHLVLHNHNDVLISPPFATDLCKDYNNILVIDNDITLHSTSLPPATSKFNSVCSIDDSVWMIPYGIWDEFNVIVEFDTKKVKYHYIDKPGKGQFYSVATNGQTAFSFPLGYSDTAFGIYINNGVKTVDIETNNHTKMHMGTVFLNGRYWSPPRGDTENYCDILSFDGQLQKFTVDLETPSITRKYSDFIPYKNKLYALPYGENDVFNDLLIFDTDTDTYDLQRLDLSKFTKKYNTSILINNCIIAIPYGNEHEDNSSKGLIYNCDTNDYKEFKINQSFGGKYRFRSGTEFNGYAVFFPSGSPNVPLLVIDIDGNTKVELFFRDYVIGRPCHYKNQLVSLAYNVYTTEHFLFQLDKNFNAEFTNLGKF